MSDRSSGITQDSLTPAQYQEFAERVGLLGHDAAAIQQGKECTTYFTLPTIDDARRLLSMASAASRPERQKTFFNAPIAARRRLGQGMHDRGEAVLFAAGTIEEADLKGQSRHFPIHVKAISVSEKTIAAGESWDVSVRGEAWDLDDMEELYVTVNVGRLVIEPGGSLVVRGNVFSLLCQQVIHRTKAGAFEIGILPTPFSADFGHGPLDGPDGVDGAAGRDGVDGRKLEVERTLLGFRLREEPNLSVMNGTPGEEGKHGTDGSRGRNGGMCKLAELTLRSVTGHLTVFAGAGEGGDGGRGGHGGKGGRGGDAGDGYKLWHSVIRGGNGGAGGHGSDGGKGGHGGNGGLASNIYIDVPAGDESKITRIAGPSKSGKAGPGGLAGTGGAGGRQGNGPETEFDGTPGQTGTSGMAGRPGACGRSRPAPWIFLNDKADGDQLLAGSPESSTAVSNAVQ